MKLKRKLTSLASLIISFLVGTGTVYAQDSNRPTTKGETATHLLFGVYTVAAFTDVSLTQYGLGKGIVYEANPVQRYFTNQGPLASGIAKGAMHFGVGYFLFRKHDKNPKGVLISIALLSAAQIAVDYSNYRQIRK